MSYARSFRRAFLIPWGTAAVVCFFAMVGFAVFAQNSALSDHRLDAEGAVATARLTNVQRNERRNTEGRTQYSYSVTYRFEVMDRTYEKKQMVSLRFYQ